MRSYQDLAWCFRIIVANGKSQMIETIHTAKKMIQSFERVQRKIRWNLFGMKCKWQTQLHSTSANDIVRKIFKFNLFEKINFATNTWHCKAGQGRAGQGRVVSCSLLLYYRLCVYVRVHLPLCYASENGHIRVFGRSVIIITRYDGRLDLNWVNIIHCIHFI